MNKDGGSAFPVTIADVRDLSAYEDKNLTGMSLRDWFAGQAMPWATPYAYSNSGSFEFKPEVIAKAAYAIADAMLAEREKE